MKTEITEKDIIDFVFYPEFLSDEKRFFLETTSAFKEEIDFYSTLKKSLGEELELDVKGKIASKIKAYQISNVIYLYPIEELKKQKYSNGLVLAAASPDDKPKVSTKTFYDDDKTYIIKVINYEKNARLFVFSTQIELMKDFYLIINPQNLKYHISDNTGPLKLDFNIDPESIQIEFVLEKRD